MSCGNCQCCSIRLASKHDILSAQLLNYRALRLLFKWRSEEAIGGPETAGKHFGFSLNRLLRAQLAPRGLTRHSSTAQVTT